MITFVRSMAVLLLLALNTPAWAEAPLPNNRHIFINVANDNGVRYNDDDYYFSGAPDYNSYYIKCDGGGLNAMHVTTDPTNSPNGQATTVQTSSTSPSGTFYLSNTGGTGYNDDLILLVSAKGTIPDNFSLNLKSSGYSFPQSQPSSATYVTNAIDETFAKADFIYGPHVFKPGPGTLGVWSLPLFYGQNTGDSSTAEHLMFVDLKLGVLNGASYPGKTNNGAIKVDYSFTNMNTSVSFNVYAWSKSSPQGQGINWTNQTSGTGSSSYTINYTP